ncbi:vitamin B12-dependent ribonucleotide reductase, partial [Candidatus Micrarchaeota archaeon]|nr:vitamin B12-dependent ribonucleotide reductase [Candidatus Micrarchaeota archaeon]
NELTWILINQYAAFNSPVWFNVGSEKHPQCSACFINEVKDDMRSILGLAMTEGLLFKYGSGTGTNFSSLRSSKEFVNAGGKASGPCSFMKGLDSFAGVIKSGGKTRRAAKMAILNIDHPDISEFINCKAKEEKKAWALIDAGYDGSVNGEAYATIQYQNANNSVRVTDEFMRAYEADAEFHTRAVTDGRVIDTYAARDLMKEIAEAAWICGDPGIQFDDVINDWHTCPNTDRIYATNPCSEFVFLDNTSCNLASLNLMKFRKDNGEFDVESFKKAVEVIITAQEITVDFSSYPTEKITENSHAFRPLGMGYANLGALLMVNGLAYDSDEGRNYAAAISSLMSGHAYKTSAKIAGRLGPFSEYRKNEKPFLRVIDKHRKATYQLSPAGVSQELLSAALRSWEEAYAEGEKHGFRNAQISCIAPTGTIGFMMDCDTTGIEPEIALVKYKWLVGGGMIKIVNGTVPLALKNLGYSDSQAKEIVDHLNKTDTIEGAPYLKGEHLPVFDCSFKAKNGSRTIAYMGHVKMMAAVQPFISGAISKTVNMPEASTADEIIGVYVQAWKMGVKAIAIYRDGCKRTQPLTTSKEQGILGAQSKLLQPLVAAPARKRLPDERRAVTHKFSIGGHEGYLTVGLYEDGMPGEIFVTMAKEGSVISGLMDSFATSVSIGLQYGVPLSVLSKKFVGMRFEPSGVTANKDIRFAKSIIDYIFKYLSIKYLDKDDLEVMGLGEYAGKQLTLPALPAIPLGESKAESSQPQASQAPSATIGKQPAPVGYTKEAFTFDTQADAPACHACGSMMYRSASCYKCANCGETSGCS